MGREETALTDRELRKLSRKDLLELLVSQSREREALQAELEQVKAALEDRQLQIERAGSIAEAALQINGIFDAAQAAAQQYLENIRQRSESIEAVCAQREELCARREEETRRKCQAMEEDARRRAEGYWTELSMRLKKFYEEHQALKELLSAGGKP